jgi:hypothetical protein
MNTAVAAVAGGNEQQMVGNVLGVVGGGLAGALGGNAGVGASINAGAEKLFTTGDRMSSTWTYFGPGVSFAPMGFSSQLSATITFYGGVCWGVPTYDAYAGGFISLSLGAGSAVFGFAFNMFWSDSNPAQNGYSVGLTVSVPFGEPGLTPNGGLSYVTYYLASSGSWGDPGPALGVLWLVPGMQIWVPFLAYKWSQQIG